IHHPGGGILNDDVAPGNDTGDGVGPSLDAVGHDAAGGAVQVRDAVDIEDLGADPLDARPHAVQHVGQVLHLRFGGGVDDGGAALAEDRGHHLVLRAADRRVVHEQACAHQAACPAGRTDDVPFAVAFNAGAHGGETCEV